MIFANKNDGTPENLIHIYFIDIQGNEVLYSPAKGSLDVIREYFDTPELAQDRYDELKGTLLV